MKLLFLVAAWVAFVPFQEAHALGRSRKKVTVAAPVFGPPKIAYGTGCLDGTATATLAPDGSAVSLIFDDFKAVAGGTRGISRALRSCKVSIPVQVPEGYQLVISKSDIRGFASIPLGAKGHVSYRAMLRDRRTESRSEKRKFPLPEGDENFTWEGAREQLVTGCGGNVTLHILTDVFAQTNNEGEETSVTIDSEDITHESGVVVRAQKRKC